MLINIETIVKKYGTPTGIIHVGSHYLEERQDYQKVGLYNTVWIDGNDKIISELAANIAIQPDEKIIHCVVSDVDGQQTKFYITNNGQSSSILEFGTHKNYYPGIQVTEVKEFNTKRLDTLFTENNISFSSRNFINLDIQGAELLALKGCGKIMDSIKYIYSEVNEEPLYKNCCLIHEMDNYLNSFGFARVETEITHCRWGDALYVR